MDADHQEKVAEDLVVPVTKLYQAFVKAALESTATNTEVAQAAILMLADAVLNMAEAPTLPQEKYNEVMGEAMTYLQNTAMTLSHDLAAAVNEIKNPPEPVSELAGAAVASEAVN